MPSRVAWPPSRYRQTARPGRIQGVRTPWGKSFGSGGGATLCTMSQLTKASRSAAAMTIRQGVVMGPATGAGRARRSISGAKRRRKG